MLQPTLPSSSRETQKKHVKFTIDLCVCKLQKTDRIFCHQLKNVWKIVESTCWSVKMESLLCWCNVGGLPFSRDRSSQKWRPSSHWTPLNQFQHTYIHMGVSENSGTPKSSILIEFSIFNHPFWGTPIFGNTHINPQISWWTFGCQQHDWLEISKVRLPQNGQNEPLQILGQKHFFETIGP